ncbi:MAG: transglycosylase SLT domain-containing protein [Gammaproteobacteria bacterium]|nr:transglycosylase SLT domain-containing protein [Gammaproteobacteria bacterium]
MRRWCGQPYRLALAVLLWVGIALAFASTKAGAQTALEQPPAARFQAAQAALEAGDRTRFSELVQSLQGHPLQAELLRAELQQRLGAANADEVLSFLDRHQGTAPAERLRRDWLKRLARERRWTDYLAAYVDNGSETRACWYRRALLATGRQQAAFDRLSELYLTGRSLPAACDPLFAAWSDVGGLTAALVWERIELALERGNAGVAEFQGRYLPSPERPWLDLLLAVHQRPALLLERPVTGELVADPRRRQQILVHGLERLAQDSAQKALLLRASLEAAEKLTPVLAERADAAIGMALAEAGDPAGLDYLDRLQPRADNLELQRERLRVALRLRAWARLADWARVLPDAADPLGKWRYWLGKALMRVAGAEPAARKAAAHAFESAAAERTLWGFLAAELIGREPALDHRPVPVDVEAVERLLASATIARVRALRDLGRQTDVRREWRELTRLLGRDEKLVAAAAAAKLGLTNESILTLARAAYWDDMELRFPLAYAHLVDAAAQRQDLPPDWVYAVIRQESAFDPDIASHAGAIGLMQLMPATAREVAGKLGRDEPERIELIDPALNIVLGSAYLAEMAERFDGHPLVASAAYNAGPTAVSRWLPDEPIPGDLWLTDIPYAETRQYVRRVLTYRVFYRERLGLPPLRIGAMLRPVGGPLEHGQTLAAGDRAEALGWDGRTRETIR